MSLLFLLSKALRSLLSNQEFYVRLIAVLAQFLTLKYGARDAKPSNCTGLRKCYMHNCRVVESKQSGNGIRIDCRHVQKQLSTYARTFRIQFRTHLQHVAKLRFSLVNNVVRRIGTLGTESIYDDSRLRYRFNDFSSIARGHRFTIR